jgi:hypothetical protein
MLLSLSTRSRVRGFRQNARTGANEMELRGALTLTAPLLCVHVSGLF